jgi:hypothetical protein
MKRFSVIFVLMFLVAGCAASGPPFKDTLFARQPVPDDKGRIIFYRESDANFGSVIIGIGDARVGALAQKGFMAVEVVPDDYRISASMRAIPIGEFVLRMRVSAGQTYYVRASHRSHRLLYPFVGVLGAGLLFADTEGEFRLEPVPPAIALPELAQLKLSE